MEQVLSHILSYFCEIFEDNKNSTDIKNNILASYKHKKNNTINSLSNMLYFITLYLNNSEETELEDDAIGDVIASIDSMSISSSDSMFSSDDESTDDESEDGTSIRIIELLVNVYRTKLLDQFKDEITTDNINKYIYSQYINILYGEFKSKSQLNIFLQNVKPIEKFDENEDIYKVLNDFIYENILNNLNVDHPELLICITTLHKHYMDELKKNKSFI